MNQPALEHPQLPDIAVRRDKTIMGHPAIFIEVAGHPPLILSPTCAKELGIYLTRLAEQDIT